MEAPKGPEQQLEGQKPSPDSKEMSTEQLESLRNALAQQIIDAAVPDLTDPNPQIKKIAQQTLLDANDALMPTGYHITPEGGKFHLEPHLASVGDEDRRAAIDNLQAIIKQFNVNRIRTMGVQGSLDKMQNRALDKEAAVMKLIGEAIKSYPQLKDNLTAMRDDASGRFDTLMDGLRKTLSGLDLKKDDDAAKANDIIFDADAQANQIIGDVRSVLEHIVATETLIDDSKTYEKGKQYMDDKFAAVGVSGLNPDQQKQVADLQKEFESNYKLLDGKTPDMAQKRAVLIATTVDKINEITGQGGKLSTSEYARKLTGYRGDSVENSYEAGPVIMKPSSFPDGGANKLVASADLRSEMTGVGCMKMMTLPPGTNVVTMGGYDMELGPAQGKKITYVRIKVILKDNSEYAGLVPATALGAAPGDEVAKTGGRTRGAKARPA